MYIKFYELKQKLQKNEKGFTLVELMVVIAILGIIAAFVINSMWENVRKGRIERDHLTLERARGAIAQYRAMHTNDANPYPATLSVLKTQHYLDEEPKSPMPSGVTFTYDSSDGKITSTDPS